jgi:replicative DNA helicase Mcm
MTGPFESQRDNTILALGDLNVTETESMLRTDIINAISDGLELSATRAKNAFYYLGAAKQKSIGNIPIVEAVPGTSPAEYRFTEYGYSEYQRLVREAGKLATEANNETMWFRDWLEIYFSGQAGNPDIVSEFQQTLDNGQCFVEIDYEVIDFLRGFRAADLFTDKYDEMVEYFKEKFIDYLEPRVNHSQNHEELARNFEVRFYNLPTQYVKNVEDIHDIDFSTFSAVRGRILEMTSVDKIPTDAAFECLRCGHTTVLPQRRFGTMVEPAECEEETCGRRGPFKLNMDETRWVNRQLIILSSNTQINGASKIRCYVEGDLCTGDTSILGKNVIITGKVSEMQRQDKGSKAKSVAFEHVMLVNNVIAADDSLTPFPSEEECQTFDELVKDTNEHGLSTVHDFIVRNTAPQIFGRDIEKTIATIPLFSDWTWDIKDAGSNRSSVHVLMLGDPGTGKSEIMKDVLRISPRGYGPQTYKAGQMSSGVGLTSVAEKSELDGKWMLKPGFLAHADGSTVGIDEIDKIKASELEKTAPVLEDQKQDVGKAGMGEFQSRCSVIMTANPSGGGKIDPTYPVIDQFKCAEYFKQRIDIIVSVPEIHEPGWDEQIAHQIADNFAKPIRSARVNQKNDPYEAERTASLDFLRKYVLYARSKERPVLTDSAREVITNHFINIKADFGPEASISGRALKSTFRVATAIARRELSDKVEYAHAQEAIRIMEYALRSISGQPVNSGMVDYEVIDVGMSHSQRDLIKMVMELIRDGYDHEDELISVCGSKGIGADKVKGLLMRLRREGSIMAVGDGSYKVP